MLAMETNYTARQHDMEVLIEDMEANNTILQNTVSLLQLNQLEGNHYIKCRAQKVHSQFYVEFPTHVMPCKQMLVERPILD